MSRSRWRFAPYALVAAGAVTGQIMAGVEHLHPTVALMYAPIFGMAAAIEGGAVWMAVLAKQRGDLGENVTPFFVVATVFAVLAVGINVVGHWGDVWLVAGFGGLSAAGYIIWCLELIALLDDSWDPDGSIRKRVPPMRILKQLHNDPHIAVQARRIAIAYAQKNPRANGLGAIAALDAAIAERDEEVRRQRIEAAVRVVMQEAGTSPTDIELAMLTYGADQIVEQMIQLAENGDMAALLVRRIAPHRLTGTNVNPHRAAPPRPAREQRPPEPEPAPQIIEGVTVAPRRSLPVRAGSDPWERHAQHLRAIMDNIPDWQHRPTPVTSTEIEAALTAAIQTGALEQAPTSKPYKLKLKWMLEALSERQVPEDQWVSGSLAGVDRDGIAGRRALLTA